MPATAGKEYRMTRRSFLLASASGCALSLVPSVFSLANEPFAIAHSDDEWRKLLTPDQFAILRQSATERPFTSPLLHEKRPGIFGCAGCRRDLFSSATKFDSGTGWPSFWEPLQGAVGTIEDKTFGMVRTAVHCSQCGGHLGHVFDDGPRPTGLRYCINGIALIFSSQVS